MQKDLAFDVEGLGLALAVDLVPARRQHTAGPEGAGAQLIELEEEVALGHLGAGRPPTTISVVRL